MHPFVRVILNVIKINQATMRFVCIVVCLVSLCLLADIIQMGLFSYLSVIVRFSNVVMVVVVVVNKSPFVT